MGDMSDISGTELQPGQRWSTWNDTEGSQSRGPEPYPDWLVTSGAAIDTELGLVKPGKEAALYLIERSSTDEQRSCLLGAKRYQASVSSWTLYAQGRDMRSQRDKRALKKMSTYGKALAQSEWANAEFRFLRLFWSHGVPVPYPVQIYGNEILMEWIGDEEGHAAPQLNDVTLTSDRAEQLYTEASNAIVSMARLGYAHGDLSPFNILVRDGHIVIIDVPQAVDIAKNPLGSSILERDCVNVARYFEQYGIGDADALFSTAISEAWSM